MSMKSTKGVIGHPGWTFESEPINHSGSMIRVFNPGGVEKFHFTAYASDYTRTHIDWSRDESKNATVCAIIAAYQKGFSEGLSQSRQQQNEDAA